MRNVYLLALLLLSACGAKLNGVWLRTNNDLFKTFCIHNDLSEAACSTILTIDTDTAGSLVMRYNTCAVNASAPIETDRILTLAIEHDKTKNSISMTSTAFKDVTKDCNNLPTISVDFKFTGTYSIQGNTLTMTNATGGVDTYTRQ